MLDMLTKEIIARNILNARHARGWSQTQLSIHAGVSQKTISNIESPNSNPNYSPTVTILIGITTALKIPLPQIFMDLELEDLKNVDLQNTIDNYLLSDQNGKKTISSVAESQAHYHAKL